MKAIYVLLMIAAMSAAGLSALSVESFVCNSQSGTVVAESGGTLVCQASVKNGDSQNSAAFNSAKLLVSGVWTDATSYTGGGFDTTISAGGSTTATFTGIGTVSPGPANKFQAILLDDSTDTFAADTTVNVLAVKSVTADATLSSATEGQQFRMDSTTIIGGDPSSATLAASLSGGCSLAAGETATKSIGDVSNNDVVSRSWQVLQGSSNCQITVTGSITASSVTVQRTATATVTNPDAGSSGSSSSSSTTSSGGGSGGGAASSQTKAVVVKETSSSIKATFSSIPKGNSAVIEIPDDVDAGITKLVFKASNSIGSSYVNVMSLDVKPSSVADVGTGDVYKYIEISHNISEGSISEATLYFDVEKSWLGANDIDADKVYLNRYNSGRWDKLATSRINETSAAFSYSSSTPGFSVFAISGEKKSGETVSEKQPTAGETQKQPEPFISGEVAKIIMDYSPLILAVVLIVVAILGYFYYHGHRHMKHKKAGYSYKPNK
ncbi:MAG: PGF-pre-PGF domain-containing protein [Candidatus Aenigmarchaeota archaeon]|nr:PGF-pre-PGF domain-containing protein [Candidatus Aenigmarchaeota archaeon]